MKKMNEKQNPTLEGVGERGSSIPHRAVSPPQLRKEIRTAPRGLRDGDAPVRGAHPRPGEHASVPGSLPQPLQPTERPDTPVLIRDGLWVVEGINDYGGGRVFDVVLIIELRDGQIWRDTRYYAEPFEAPEWRARWIEPMETGA